MSNEIQVSKSPAEFFAENQAIAGFDNMGKSLYTTLRELIENSLDACESVGVLPSISVRVEEMTQDEFNVVRGLVSPSKKAQGIERRDTALFVTKGSGKKGARKSLDQQPDASVSNGTTGNVDGKKKEDTPANKRKRKRDTECYFKISVRDNGCGMSHAAIPNLLGRVLSGSKYGVRQTRGKFGLGAKMALIWSKKSTNMPISVKTAHMKKPGQLGSHVSTCVLDIDIYKNEPRVMLHKKQLNKEEWIGTEMEVVIAGNWTTYKARIVQYLQQLAIITPYAQLELTYQNQSDSKRDMAIRYDRRSEQMPPPAKEVKHHPASVNNLLVQQLLMKTQQKTLSKFLIKDLSAVSPALAKRLIAELGFDEEMDPTDVNDKQVTKLVQLLRSVELFKAPDGSCLSPLGEYNLNLGIRKVLEPDLVATARDKPSAYEGHPFIVEAAVSIGGKDVKEGITVVRFANRIPLLFEAGADVATRVAQSKIRWANYKMDHKRDKIGVFVSIVSTKVPFKGTGKEYIGDDITEIQVSVKRALQSCCQQLRTHLAKKHALRDIKERKNRLVKYIPDVSRSLFAILDQMRERKEETDDAVPDESNSPTKRLRHDENAVGPILDKIASKEITEAGIKKLLFKTVEEQNAELDDFPSSGSKMKSKSNKDGVPLFLVPMYDRNSNQHDLLHPLFVFRPIKKIRMVKSS